MKKILTLLGLTLPLFFFASPVFAASTSPELVGFTGQTLGYITAIASIAAVLFVVKGGVQYMTSSGSPDGIESAKKTIKNALLGLLIVLSASFIIGVFNQAFNSGGGQGSAGVNTPQIETVKPTGGLAQVLIDAVSG